MMITIVTARAITAPGDSKQPAARTDADLSLSFKSIPINPILPTPQHEAADMVGLVRRGTPIQEIRDLIDVTPAQQKWLLTVTEGDPFRRETVRRAIEFRVEVRRIFERLIAIPPAEPVAEISEDRSDEPCPDSIP